MTHFSDHLSDELRIGAMVRALANLDAPDPTALGRSVAYLTAGIPEDHIIKFDAVAARIYQFRRVAMADAADQDSQRSAA